MTAGLTNIQVTYVTHIPQIRNGDVYLYKQTLGDCRESTTATKPVTLLMCSLPSQSVP